MKGIEKITAKIIEEANEAAAAKIKDAESEASAIAESYAAIAEAETAKILDAGKTEASRLTERLAAAAQTESKKAVLAEKQTLIREAFSIAEAELSKLPDSDKLNITRVMPDGSVQHKRDAEAVLAQRQAELTPRVAEILFAEET
jgi:vacuolar-type H+-ATPase subunit E/Vma4